MRYKTAKPSNLEYFFNRNIEGDENIDYVVCKICNKRFLSLPSHLKIHNIN